MSKYQPTYPPRLQRSPLSKPSYSPPSWKKYLIKNFDAQSKDSRISHDKQSQKSHHPSTTSQITIDKRVEMGEQRGRRKEEMIRRVKQIQNKVMPLIENDESSRTVEQMSGRRKLEQKVGKLERVVDGIGKEMEIKIEKRFLEIEKQYSEKISGLEKKIK